MHVNLRDHYRAYACAIDTRTQQLQLLLLELARDHSHNCNVNHADKIELNSMCLKLYAYS